MPDNDSTPYSNREIREKWHDLSNTLTTISLNVESGFRDVKEKQDKTNGRVSSLERWQYAFMGGLSVLSVIVVPLLAWALYTLSNINDTVHRSVDEALSAYNLEVTK